MQKKKRTRHEKKITCANERITLCNFFHLPSL